MRVYDLGTNKQGLKTTIDVRELLNIDVPSQFQESGGGGE